MGDTVAMRFRPIGASLATALCITSGIQLACGQTSPGPPDLAEGASAGGAASPVVPGAPAGPPDQPIVHMPASAALTVTYVVEHRSALSQSRVTVSGIVAWTLSGNGACATGTGMCAQPRIKLVDALTDMRQPVYELTVLLRADADAEFTVGQRVEISGRVSGGPSGVVIHAD